jgi:3-oxoacyl-[acyl-carrier protein] reductase
MSKNILITGSSRGIGKHIALHLAPNNHLFLHYNQDKIAVEATAEEAIAKGATVDIIQADLSEEAGYIEIHEQVARVTDKLDVLINNAGVLPQARDQDNIAWQDWQTTFAINLFSVVNLSIACQVLLEKGTDPSIINFSSVAVKSGSSLGKPKFYEFLAYSSSKAGVETITKGFSRSFASKIRVNAIAPGVIPTDIQNAFINETDEASKGEKTKKMFEETAKFTSVKRNGTFEDINQTVDLLINNGYITGQIIRVNGGLGI